MSCPAGARSRPGLAVRAPVADPVIWRVALPAAADRTVTAQAGLTSVHPVPACGPEVAGRRLRVAVLVGLQQAMCEVDPRAEISDVTHRGPRRDAAQEAQLGLVDVAYPGEVALVDQRLADLAVRLRGQPSGCLGRVPVRAEQVGTEVPDQLVLAWPWDDVDYRDPVPHGVVGAIGQHDPHLPLRTT